MSTIRNIDFEALKALRDRHGAAFPRGRVICKQGDTTAEMYVVLQGSVEISIADPDTGAKKVVAVAPAGDFFGEMSCFGGMPRTATATCAEDSVLLFFNQETAIQLLRASPRFALGVIQRLADRVKSSNDQIARLTAAIGAERANDAAPAAASGAAKPAGATAAAAVASAARSAGREIPTPEFDKQTLWARPVTCPVSGTRFSALNVRPDAIKVKTRESDFRDVYAGANPLWYLVYVCPECFYAAYPDDFATPSPDEVNALADATDERAALAAGKDFAGERTAEHAVIAFELALSCYGLRAPNAQRTAGLYHRLAWLAREAGDPNAERDYLAEAQKQYLEAVAAADPAAQLMLQYTIGDLHLRLGNPAEAVKTFAQVSQNPAFKQQPDIQRLTRDRWLEAREIARKPAASPA